MGIIPPSKTRIAVLSRHQPGSGPLSPEEVLEWIEIPLPGGRWRMSSQGEDGFCLVNPSLRQSVIVSACIEEDGKRWVHVSIASPDRMPSYEDLCWLKRTFLGEDARAVMVFPAADRHVNLHERCLHLWGCLDDDGLPEFSGFHPAAGGKRSI